MTSSAACFGDCQLSTAGTAIVPAQMTTAATVERTVGASWKMNVLACAPQMTDKYAIADAGAARTRRSPIVIVIW